MMLRSTSGLVALWLLFAMCEAQIQGDLRLVDGPDQYEGRVEIFYNGQWGSFCEYNTDGTWQSVGVVCDQLGFGPPDWQFINGGNLYNGPVAVSKWNLLQLHCDGSEARVTDCPNFSVQQTNCPNDQYAGVRCAPLEDGVARLVDGPDQYHGRLEVYDNGQWGSVCSSESSEQNVPQVMCSSLGSSADQQVVANGDPVPGPYWAIDIQCNGGEDQLSECNTISFQQTNCSVPGSVWVVCDSVATNTYGDSDNDWIPFNENNPELDTIVLIIEEVGKIVNWFGTQILQQTAPLDRLHELYCHIVHGNQTCPDLTPTIIVEGSNCSCAGTCSGTGTGTGGGGVTVLPPPPPPPPTGGDDSETCHVLNGYGPVIDNDCCFYFAEKSTCCGSCQFKLELDPHQDLAPRDCVLRSCVPLYKRRMSTTRYCYCGNDCRGKDTQYPGWEVQKNFETFTVTKCACKNSTNWQAEVQFDPYYLKFFGASYVGQTTVPDEGILKAAMEKVLEHRQTNVLPGSANVKNELKTVTNVLPEARSKTATAD